MAGWRLRNEWRAVVPFSEKQRFKMIRVQTVKDKGWQYKKKWKWFTCFLWSYYKELWESVTSLFFRPDIFMSFVMTRVLKNKQTVEEVVAVFFDALVTSSVWSRAESCGQQSEQGLPMDLIWRPAILHKLWRGRTSEPALWPIVNMELWRANPSSFPPISLDQIDKMGLRVHMKVCQWVLWLAHYIDNK